MLPKATRRRYALLASHSADAATWPATDCGGFVTIVSAGEIIADTCHIADIAATLHTTMMIAIRHYAGIGHCQPPAAAAISVIALLVTPRLLPPLLRVTPGWLAADYDIQRYDIAAR